eukprot:scaffold6967_cov123-Isochrysis_galbana.AAC.13
MGKRSVPLCSGHDTWRGGAARSQLAAAIAMSPRYWMKVDSHQLMAGCQKSTGPNVAWLKLAARTDPSTRRVSSGHSGHCLLATNACSALYDLRCLLRVMSPCAKYTCDHVESTK